MSKMVWVETTHAGVPVRIFRSRLASAGYHRAYVMRWDRTTAVGIIRHLLFLRSGGICELCGSLVTEKSGHMHEQKTRGKGGEISLENSVFICARTHVLEHQDRNPQWTKVLRHLIKKDLTLVKNFGIVEPDETPRDSGSTE